MKLRFASEKILQDSSLIASWFHYSTKQHGSFTTTTPQSPKSTVRQIRSQPPDGCFELCDRIGIDVAVDVLDYMHETLGERYAPCPLLERKVEEGAFGKKVGRGFYDWEDGAADVPIEAGREEIEERLVAVAINEAAKLVSDDVADSDEIGNGLQLGAGFPEGPTRMAADLGYDRLRDLLSALHDESGGIRYAPADHLEKWADEGGPDTNAESARSR